MSTSGGLIPPPGSSSSSGSNGPAIPPIDANTQVQLLFGEAPGSAATANTGALGGNWTVGRATNLFQIGMKDAIVPDGGAVGSAYQNTGVINGAYGAGPHPAKSLTVSCLTRYTAAVAYNATLVVAPYGAAWAPPYQSFLLGVYGPYSNPHPIPFVSIAFAGAAVVLSPPNVHELTVGGIYMLSATYDGANIKLYSDGIEIASVAETRAIDWGSASGWQVASEGESALPCSKDGYAGLICDVRIEDVARSSAYLQNMAKIYKGML